MTPVSARDNNRRRATQQAVAPDVTAAAPCTDLFSPAMQALLDCANQGLIECDRPVGRAFLAPGAQVAFDDCCEGQLWVRLITMFPSGRPFPAQDSAQPCGIVVMAVQLGVGVVRCAHTVDDNGLAPTPAELTEDTLNMTADASTLLSAIQCCALPAPADQLIRVGAWTPQGVQGGCCGGEWQVTVGMGGCGCH